LVILFNFWFLLRRAVKRTAAGEYNFAFDPLDWAVVMLSASSLTFQMPGEADTKN
jgi:hypothetical protein